MWRQSLQCRDDARQRKGKKRESFLYVHAYASRLFQPFHKKCFKCCICKRPLDSVTHCDAPDGEIYCKLCYAKKYGPKGYGFAAGSGGVLVAENIP